MFEDEADEPHEGVIVSAAAFARAVRATDDPPMLVLLNSCRSAAQIDNVATVAPFAIGMADSIAGLSGRDVLVMCGHGERAATAASVLERAGVTGVAILPRGPQDWADAATGRALQVDA